MNNSKCLPVVQATAVERTIATELGINDEGKIGGQIPLTHI